MTFFYDFPLSGTLLHYFVNFGKVAVRLAVLVYFMLSYIVIVNSTETAAAHSSSGGHPGGKEDARPSNNSRHEECHIALNKMVHKQQ